jgi:hypothetical protein
VEFYVISFLEIKNERRTTCGTLIPPNAVILHPFVENLGTRSFKTIYGAFLVLLVTAGNEYGR